MREIDRRDGRDRDASQRARGAAARCAAALLLLASPLLTACDRGPDPNAFVPPPPPEVVVARPVQREVTTYAIYTGTVEASERVELRARVQGFLESIHFQPGQKVAAGDLLFVIDPRQYQAQVDQAQANVQAQAAALVGAENDARLARELADQRAGPEIDAIIKAARRDAMKAELERAEANLAQAQLDLDYTRVTAPIAGRISRNFVDIGNLVGRSEPTLLAEIVQAQPAYVSVDLSESDVLEARRRRLAAGEDGIEPGQIAPGVWRPSELALAGDGEFAVKGRVDYVDPKIDELTGTLTVRTRYENEDGSLIPGYFARVRFGTDTKAALLVPEAALLADQQGRYALVVNDENMVEPRRVRVGALDDGMRVVEEGLGPTDRVVVLGVLKARPGSKVTPKVQESAAASR